MRKFDNLKKNTFREEDENFFDSSILHYFEKNLRKYFIARHRVKSFLMF